MVSGYLAAALSVPADRDAIKAVPLDKLVQAASDLVVEVQTAPDPAKWGQLALSLLPFAPAVDGAVLPQAPLAAIAAGQGSDVRLLTGFNRDEARLFLVAAGTIDLIDGAALEAAAGAYRLPADCLAVYQANRPGASAGDILAAVVTDWFFGIPSTRAAEARAARGKTNTWVDRFDHPAPGENTGSARATEPKSRSCSTRSPATSSVPSSATRHRRPSPTEPTRYGLTSSPAETPAGRAPCDTVSRTTGAIAERINVIKDPAASERTCWDGIR